MAKKKERKVVVTTEHRGVFFGSLKSYDQERRCAVLTDARNCVYWHASVKGFLGLAAVGPLEGSRVGPAVPQLMLESVTAVVDCTDEAAERWEAGPWS